MAEHICPHCKRPVYDDDALLCLYCGESLGRGSRRPWLKYVFAAVALIVILSFVLTMMD